MSLAQRLAALTVAFAILLVLGTTEFTLSWSAQSRLDDLRNESEALAETWTAYLNRAAPTGDSAAVTQAIASWPNQHITETSAAVFRARGTQLALLATSDSAVAAAGQGELAALREGSVQAWRQGEPEPAWRVAQPVGVAKIYGVLSIAVSTRTLESQARMERRLAYASAFAAALFLGMAIWWLVRRWVGRPLASLESAMEEVGRRGPHHGASVRVAGPSEIRRLAARYNELQAALGIRERESEARGELLALEERARGLERVALAEQAGAEFAHEIGTPLNTVNGHLQLLREDLVRQSDAGAVGRVEAVLKQVSRVSGIVRAKLDRGGWPELALQRTDVVQIADHLLRFMEPALGSGRVTTEIVTDGSQAGRLWAKGDPALVEQILLNLFKNAIEAMPRGGHIRVVGGRTDRGRVWVEVADNGPGLTDRARDTLFTPYTTTKERAGTGLGLPISRRLARVMGGELELVPSITGTRWRLTLPDAGHGLT